MNPKFKHLYEGKNLNITQADLEALPNLQTYEACNWLHYIHWDLQKGAIKEDPTPSDKKISQSPYFKQELYQTILRIISLSDELIKFFTQNYITNPYDITIVSEFIITRKKQLREAAEQISAFAEYRQSAQARKDILEFLKYLKTFKTMGKSFLISEFEDEYKINFEATLFGNTINEYTQIVKFVINLDDLSKELSQNILLLSIQEKFKLYIESLNKITHEYFIFPTILTKEVLYETLKQIKKDLEKENLLESPIISDFISLINSMLSTNNNLKQEKNVMLALPPISTLFKGNHQKVLDVYHQRDMDISSSNFTL